MSETTTVIHKETGFGFSIKVEREIRTETGAKYPDKTLVNAQIDGNVDTFNEVVVQINSARDAIDTMLSKYSSREPVTANAPPMKTDKLVASNEPTVT